MSARRDVIIVGGGQAGLALGWHLAGAGVDFAILDGGARVGDVWRSRWDSLRLFTPAQYDSLPGMPFPAEPDHLPTKDEVADYLESYAAAFGLPVQLDEQVHTVRPMLGGGFLVATSQTTWEAEQVVIATGPFQQPVVPTIARELDVPSLHSSEYRNPEQLPAGPVLVVGGGNSGVQIAEELSVTHDVTLAVGTRMTRLPARLLGRSIFWWLEKSRALDASVDTAIGRRMRERETLIGTSYNELRRSGVRITGRALSVEGCRVHTADGTVDVAAVVWATGFARDYRYLHAPVFDDRCRPVHHRGVTRVPGLYFLGLPWQHTRGSALLGFVGRDAAFIAERIRDNVRSHGRTQKLAQRGMRSDEPVAAQHRSGPTLARGSAAHG